MARHTETYKQREVSAVAKGRAQPFAELCTSRLPLPYAGIFGALADSQTTQGLVRTALDTSRAIEAWFELQGMLVLAEYLDLGAPDMEVNRLVFSMLEWGRQPLTGQWMAIARGCLQSLQKRRSEDEVPTWRALASLDLGEVGDDTHPVDRLLRFRNSLSHGTFVQDDKAVIEHVRLLESCASPLLHELIEKPISFQDPSGQVNTLGNEHSAAAAPPSPLPLLTPFVQLEKHQWRILAPAVQVHETGKEWVLVPGRFRADSSDEQMLRFESALHQFRRERQGHVRFSPEHVPERPETADLQLSGLDEALAKGATFTLIEYRPGTGQRRLAAHLWQTLRKQLSHVGVWRVIPDHPGASGNAFAKALLRWSEDALELSEGALEPSGDSLSRAVKAAAQRLSAAGRTLGVILMDAALGLERASDEDRSIMDLCKSVPATGGFRIFLLAHPGHGTSLPHDGMALTTPLPSREAIDMDELTHFVGWWWRAHDRVGNEVLAWLLGGEGQEPWYLSDALQDIADRLEPAPFPAAVEHALWTAASLLERLQLEDGRFIGCRKSAFF